MLYFKLSKFYLENKDIKLHVSIKYCQIEGYFDSVLIKNNYVKNNIEKLKVKYINY